MLERLSVQRFLLLDDIDVVFREGFNVLTGETGAGKSLLTGALDLCLGGRAEPDMVRPPHPAATLTAVFSGIPALVQSWLEDQGLPCEDTLILKRVVAADKGKNRAFVNDQSVTLTTLRSVGSMMVHIHGQFDPLLDPARAMELLDLAGDLGLDGTAARTTFDQWQEALAAVSLEEERIRQLREQRAQNTVARELLERLRPLPDEENTLLEERRVLRQCIRSTDLWRQAQGLLEHPGSCLGRLQETGRLLARTVASQDPDPDSVQAATLVQDTLGPLGELSALVSARANIQEKSLEADMDRVDTRLAELREAARILQCPVGDLRTLQHTMNAAAHADDPGQMALLRQRADTLKAAFLSAARVLSDKRILAARRLEAEVTALFGTLNLHQARFMVEVTPREEPARSGLDRVAFTVQTQPGLPPGPPDRVASGGERSRIMLALRTCLAARAGAPVVIFDEIDSGMSGTVSHKVGSHMAAMGHGCQVISITHAPQVAAQARHHLSIRRVPRTTHPCTQVIALNPEERAEELARMMAGASVTNETLALARHLLGQTPGMT